MKFLSINLLFIFAASAFADAPLPAPKSYRTCDTYISVCAYSEVDQDTTFYSVEGEFQLTELYKINGWHRSLFIAPKGAYVVVGYSGLNLVSKSVTKEEVMLKIYKQGKLFRKYTQGQIFNNLNSLKATTSHYHWGHIKYVGFREIELETPEGSVFIELNTGKVYLPTES
ncbi:MAG: hypothetical protein ACSHW0_19610 [Thalassotalea sp.]